MADELTEAYEFLRQLEHRLQMVDDQQTQTLPSDAAGLARIAGFMAYDSLEDFQDTLLYHLRRVDELDVFEPVGVHPALAIGFVGGGVFLSRNDDLNYPNSERAVWPCDLRLQDPTLGDRRTTPAGDQLKERETSITEIDVVEVVVST